MPRSVLVTSLAVLLFAAEVRSLTQAPNRFQFSFNNKIPTTKPKKTFFNVSLSHCALTCSTDEDCLSFTHHGMECGLMEVNIPAAYYMEDKEGYTYFNRPGTKCSSCPTSPPDKTSYKAINGRRVAHVLCTATKTFADANQACACTGGHLATVPDKESNQAIKYLMSNEKYTGAVWLGFQGYTGTNGKPYSLTRADGNVLTHQSTNIYHNWMNNAPADNGNSEAVIITKDGQWDDRYQTDSNAYICEYVKI